MLNSFNSISLFVHERIRDVVLVVVVVLLTVGFFFGLREWKESKDRKAADALYGITKETSLWGASRAKAAPAQDWKATSTALDGFLAHYKGSSLAGVAYLFKGRAELEQDHLDTALQAFEQAQKKLRDPYRVLAREGEAMSLSEMKRWGDAEIVWREISEQEDNPLRAFHLWNLGLTQEAASHPKEALETYRRFEKAHADSPLMEKVRARVQALSATSPST